MKKCQEKISMVSPLRRRRRPLQAGPPHRIHLRPFFVVETRARLYYSPHNTMPDSGDDAMTMTKTGRLFCGLLFTLIVLVTLLIPSAEGPYRWALTIPLVLSVVFFRLRFPALFGPALFLLLCYLFRLAPLPPLSFLYIIPIVLYTAVVRFTPSIRRETTWLTWGAVTPRLVAGALAVVVVSGAALFLWYRIVQPDIAAFTRFIPEWPMPLLLLGGLGFAVLNGVVEEVIFRGIVWDGVAALVSAPVALLVLQALFFGTAHFWGVPSGIVGAVLATIYGVMLGIIRQRAGGLVMAVVTHVFADLVIFCILLDIIGKI